MSDICKDFEAWAVMPQPVINQLYSESFPIDRAANGKYSHPFTQCAYEGYQAGRAHDIGGLIAEIEQFKTDNSSWLAYPDNTRLVCKAVDGCIEIIRKHSGKE